METESPSYPEATRVLAELNCGSPTADFDFDFDSLYQNGVLVILSVFIAGCNLTLLLHMRVVERVE